ncbi:ABC transporter substrate-binding protein [Acinetobacter bouvetii]|uniref:Putative ABC transporter solute-binding protein YclQ n=1 Tax=Acinetobacter bouvetii TaxID=202951 RepID=A0A811GFC8_9GAMM|nr:ABC transporter substrate-binding protein [Acinetobacter bouvetii]CAB1215800.1 putative ABC transporter solute-binding protein YclQ [Acinetobacter bouvetii]
MKTKALILSFIFASVGMTGVAHSANFDLKHENQNIQLKQVPKKIAVYDLSTLDTLNALNIQAEIVPVTNYTGHLAHYNQARFIKAGSLFEPDLTQLKQLKPDLIFVGGRSAKTLTSLQPIAATINFSPNTQQYMQDLKIRSLNLAQAFNRVDLAKSKLKALDQLQQQVKQQTQNQSAVMLFAVGDEYMPHAANDRFGFVYELTGFKSVLALTDTSTSKTRPEAGSKEALALKQQNEVRLKDALQQNPDYLIVLDRGAVNKQNYATKQGIKEHPLLGQSEAVKQNRVIFVDADVWYLTGAGLDNTTFMLKEISAALPK